MDTPAHVVLTIVVALYIVFAFSHNVDAVIVTQSDSVSIGATVSTLPVIVDAGGASGGVGYQSGIRFSGYAYPFATVTVQNKNTSVSVAANKDGSFAITLPQNQWQLYSLFATDSQSRRSTLLNFPSIVYAGYLTDITSIRFAPTITSDKLAVVYGDFLTITGSALPGIPVVLTVDGVEHTVFHIVADATGVYTITVPIRLVRGQYLIKAYYQGDTRSSKGISIIVGDATLTRNEAMVNIPGDCNSDQRITLVDFSVLAYWFGKNNPPSCVDVNHDGVVTLVDISIVAYYWTG